MHLRAARLLATAGVAAAFATGLAAQERAPAKADLTRLTEAFLSGGGVWRRDNPQWAPGRSEPRYWVRVHARGPGDAIATANAYAVDRAGHCERIAHLVWRWNAGAGTLETVSYAASGDVFRGSIEPLRDGSFRTTMSGTAPDGSQIRFRDTSDFSDPTRIRTRAEAWDGQVWRAVDAVEWVAVTGRACG